MMASLSVLAAFVGFVVGTYGGIWIMHNWWRAKEIETFGPQGYVGKPALPRRAA